MVGQNTTLLQAVNSIDNSEISANIKQKLSNINMLIELGAEETLPGLDGTVRDSVIHPDDFTKYRNQLDMAYTTKELERKLEDAQDVQDTFYRFADNNAIVQEVIEGKRTLPETFGSLIESYLQTPQRHRKAFIDTRKNHSEILPLEKKLGNQSKYFVQKAPEQGPLFQKTWAGEKIHSKVEVGGKVGALTFAGAALGWAIDVFHYSGAGTLELAQGTYEWPLIMGAGFAGSMQAIKLFGKTNDEPLNDVITGAIHLQGKYNSSQDLLSRVE